MKIDKEGIRKLKASLANIVLFLSIFVVLFPLTLTTVSAAGNTWEVPGDFDGIQEAIDDDSVKDGDTILVHAGTYYETITVYKQLTLQGDSKTNTTIDADHTGTVITISASWVNVTGFT